jgi:hypothetical protein
MMRARLSQLQPTAAICVAWCVLAAAGSGCGFVYRGDTRPPQLAAHASYEDQYAEAAYKRKKEQEAKSAASLPPPSQPPAPSPPGSQARPAPPPAHGPAPAPAVPPLPETYCLRVADGPVIAEQPACAGNGAADRFLSLHVHSLKSFQRAMTAAQALAVQHGRDAFVVRVDLPGSGRWYRVCAGRFQDRQDAQRFSRAVAGSSEVIALVLSCGR